MLKLLDWLRRLDFRNFTPLQWGIFIVGVLFVLAFVNFLLNLAMSLLPIAVLALVVYVFYTTLTSQHEDASSAKPKRDAMNKPKRDGESSASHANDTASEHLVIIDESPPQRQATSSAEDIAAQLEERRRRLLRGSGE